MTLPYTPAQADAAHAQWHAMCGHFAIAAATGRPLDDIRTAGVPLKGWMNPTMVTQTLDALQVRHELCPLVGIDPETALSLVDHGAILRIQWAGRWLNPGVPKGAAYQRTHYIALKNGTIMDPMYEPNVWLPVKNWLPIIQNHLVPQIKNATGYHFTHAWTPPLHL